MNSLIQDGPIALNIGNICGGAVPDLFDHEIAKVLDNIADPNTDPEQPRRLTIQFDIVPTEGRNYAAVKVSTKLKLAAIEGKSGDLHIQRRSGVSTAYTENPAQLKLLAREDSPSPNRQ